MSSPHVSPLKAYGLKTEATPAIVTFYPWWLALFLSLHRCSVNVCGMNAKWSTEMSKKYYFKLPDSLFQDASLGVRLAYQVKDSALSL